jgi:hypothetical protein
MCVRECDCMNCLTKHTCGDCPNFPKVGSPEWNKINCSDGGYTCPYKRPMRPITRDEQEREAQNGD